MKTRAWGVVALVLGTALSGVLCVWLVVNFDDITAVPRAPLMWTDDEYLSRDQPGELYTCLPDDGTGDPIGMRVKDSRSEEERQAARDALEAFDPDTGLGWPNGEAMSIIAGGEEMYRVDWEGPKDNPTRITVTVIDERVDVVVSSGGTTTIDGDVVWQGEETR